ncbi:MAG TPA: hypothetical protein PK089_04765, partial [Methanoregulaceae archaeon]|nr:hypothetical protein [Methanoregulaceae archaeon]HQJ88756.1 hypothetical protein [Methanoregulaceae archaeon]
RSRETGPEGNYSTSETLPFRGYLKRKLAAKGGIRRIKLFLYLGEYVCGIIIERRVIKPNEAHP